jgi:hypothetical protein
VTNQEWLRKLLEDVPETTWDDAELGHYLLQAAETWTADRHIVYQAVVYAIDSIMMGAATALNFGAGQENFDMVSVWQRLQQWREMIVQWLETEAAQPALVIQDLVFNTDDPEYPGNWDDLGPYGSLP